MVSRTADAHVEIRIPSRLGFHRVVLAAVSQTARLLGFSEERVDDIVLAVGEACINAIEHGNRFREDLTVKVELAMEAGRLEIRIIDQGRGMEPRVPASLDIARKICGEEPPRGMGLFLIERLVDECEFANGSPEGNCTRLVFLLEDGRRPGSGDRGGTVTGP